MNDTLSAVHRRQDVLIIGGGLIGLSTAMHLAQLRPDLSITLIEKDPSLTSQQSGHNSGVLHAGIYYEPGSMKARFCVEGNRALAVFCDAHGLPLRRCGKVIVAADERSKARLTQLYRRGTENGVPDLRLLDRAELTEIEPNVDGRMALYAPRSAIVDFRAIGATYATIFRGAGGRLCAHTRFLGADRDGGRTRVLTDRGDVDATLVINCGGLHSDMIARKMGADPGLQIVPFRGEYYLLDRDRRDLVNGLVYPVPNPSLPFLDVHLTPKISGDVEAGPNAVLATCREGYRWRDFALREFAGTLAYPGFWRLAARNIKPGIAEINRSLRKSVFVKSLQKLIPAIHANDLTAGRAGVRAQAVDRRGMLVDDFRIEETADAIHVLNAPSPAATSSMMIGRFVANKADLRLNSG